MEKLWDSYCQLAGIVGIMRGIWLCWQKVWLKFHPEDRKDTPTAP